MKQFHLNQDSVTEETLLVGIIVFECNPVWHRHFISEMQEKQFFFSSVHCMCRMIQEDNIFDELGMTNLHLRATPL